MNNITDHPLYGVWGNMKSRCYNPNMTGYKCCGGKGITVCDEWVICPIAFVQWALHNGYKKGLVFCRKDNNGNYEPNNCKFITKEESWCRR